MKRKIFIGSSKEGIEIANRMRDQINTQLGDWIECETWRDGNVFSLNKNTLECLVKASRKYDYGILVASKDDILLKRLMISRVMRDNVLFEMGLFLGSLGLQRAFLVTHDKISLPSDYDGVTVVKYSAKTIDDKIKGVIAEILKTKNSFNLKPVPSAALALGYFQSFILPFARKHFELLPDFHLKIFIPMNISDVNAQIAKYKAENPSSQTVGNRPIAYQYEKIEGKDHYWDIPTTLQTIDLLLDYFVPSLEVGINIEKQDWIQHELRNFKGTLEMLINNHEVYKNNLTIEFL